MTQGVATICVELEKSASAPITLTTPLLEIAGARLMRVLDSEAIPVEGWKVDGTTIRLQGLTSVGDFRAVLEIPRRLLSADDLEREKLEFERSKHQLENVWRTRTFFWTIISGLVGVAAPLLFGLLTDGKTSPRPIAVTVDQVAACRDSIRRLTTLAGLSNQTVTGLAMAIRNHEALCEPTVSKIIEGLAK